MKLPTSLGEAVLMIKRLMKANARLRAIVSSQAKQIEAYRVIHD